MENKSKLQEDLRKIRDVHNKCIKVIDSCGTEEQLESAKRYVELAVLYWNHHYPSNFKFARHRQLLTRVIDAIQTMIYAKSRKLRIGGHAWRARGWDL
jgi:hypothetical protein